MKNALFETALSAARRAGGVIRRGFRHLEAGEIRRKGKNDFVTRVDFDAETAIKKVIAVRFPKHRILAEETGYSAPRGEYLWVIDPLDGTANFIHGLPHFAVSLALQKDDRVIFGMIYEPLSRDCFHAFSGQGAFLNGRPIRVSPTAVLADALGATGFPFKAPARRGAYTRVFKNLLDSCKDMRRCGAAALDLAYVACGRYDFFWEAHLMPWDFLAGKLIVEEAGGRTSDFFGYELGLQESTVLAANGKIFPCLLKELKNHFRPAPD
jgi:myo-inositol-1(or 4)-monophosphatase